jgi:hypothetical protein
MKTFFRCGLTALIAGWTVISCLAQMPPPPGFTQDPEIAAQLKAFAAKKENQAEMLAKASGDKLPPQFKTFFSAVQNGDWNALTNNASKMRASFKGDPRSHGAWWQPVLETLGAAEQFSYGDEKYATTYGNDIIQSIPTGSIYFGGTDPGRFIVTMMQKSSADGDPFFTLTQNMLSDAAYFDYLSLIYGGKIYVPTTNDLQKCYDDYYADVQRRMQANQLEPGEDVSVDPKTGKMQVAGMIAVEEIHALLAKIIFDQNPGREFYIEESFPFASMYPHLEPHGLIFKLNHEQLTELSDDVIQHDHDYWAKTISPMLGDWLKEDTSVSDVATFDAKVFLHHDFRGFTGDASFVQNAHSGRMFSKERCSIAGLYAWRAQHASDSADKQRMNDAADFAFRQAFALCPDSPEVVFGYVAFLMTEKRTSDALAVAETAQKFRSDPSAESIDQLVSNLKDFQAGNPRIRFQE